MAAIWIASASTAALVAPGLASAAKPKVDYLNATSVSMTGATIGAEINPEGSETHFEIFLECQSAQETNETCGPLTVGPQRQEGLLWAGFEPLTETDSVTGLQPGYLYKFDVIATNSAGREGFEGGGFLTCPAQDSCPSQPWWPGQSLWVREGAERAGAEAPRLEAEREAKHREEEERPAKEAAERAAKEREIREAGERAGREAAERARKSHECVVPKLKGDPLPKASVALGEAHCRLGKLTKPRGDHGPLVVVGQAVPAGKKLAAGARVGLSLGARGNS